MMDEYIVKGGKRLRLGYTTGSLRSGGSESGGVYVVDGTAFGTGGIDNAEGNPAEFAGQRDSN